MYDKQVSRSNLNQHWYLWKKFEYFNEGGII